MKVFHSEEVKAGAEGCDMLYVVHEINWNCKKKLNLQK